jgi:hypothetical protein
MIQITNPWGAVEDFDIQRSDLWLLDISPIVRLVQKPQGVALTQEYVKYANYVSNAVDSNNFARKITLPESSISAFKVISGTQGTNMPGYDEPLSATRLDFFHETTGDDAAGIKSSSIYNLLVCWQLLAMAGQKRFNRIPLPLAHARSKPTFTCDLTLTFLKGSEDGATLNSGSTYFLLDCWLSDLQLPDLDYAGSDLALIAATIQIGSITPQRQS